jgi:hypothetical protein
MLTHNEEALFLESVEKIRQRAVHNLGSNRDVSAAIAFAANLHRSVDKVMLQAVDNEPKPECKTGCAWCCSLLVEAIEPEIFLIARGIKMREPARVSAIINALQTRAANTKDDANNSRRADCAFLENDLCSIYEVRPSVCRKAHSLSVTSCRSLASEIPQKLEVLLGADALMKGVADAYRQLKLQTSSRELCNAVLLALTDETAEIRWYNGETVFPDTRA